MNHKLPNYLRSYRKRCGFSQEEVAFLIGSGTRTVVSRHERYDRLPRLEMVLAYETIYQSPPQALFEGIHRAVKEATHKRALELMDRLSLLPETPALSYKISCLRRLCNELDTTALINPSHE